VDNYATGLGQANAPALNEVLEGLNDLLQLDHDAVGAYDIAIEKLQDRDHADQIAGFRRDHERHIRELNELIGALGGTPKNEPHATGPFKQGLQSLGGLAGDRGLLMAWRTNELQVRTKYDSYASKANMWPADVKRMIDRAALDEERHYAWVADVLQRMGIGSGESADVDGMNAARERANVGAGAVNQAKEKVAAAAGAVQNRITGLLDTQDGPLSGVAGRVSDVTGRARGHAQTGMSTARDAAGTVEEQIRERPVQTLLLAGLAGFIIGRILR
jgi:rubrerythrin